jgi:GTPase SAR1 family protein
MAREKKGLFGSSARHDYTCPFCFNVIDLNNIHRTCTNPACAREFAKTAFNSKDRVSRKYVNNDGTQEVDYERCIYLGKDPMGSNAVFTKAHIIRNNRDTCDICGRQVFTRVCPICHNMIPQGAEDDENSIFVVLGPKGVGKSHYIAVLINQLKEIVAPEFNGVLSAATDGTTIKYRDAYYKRLYDEKRLLPSTQPTNSVEKREPLIYYLRIYKDNKPQVFTFAFFDTAGEDLATASSMMSKDMSAFLSKAAGIVFLVDPLQVRYINTRINAESKPEVGPDVSDILNNISRVIRASKGIKNGDKVDTPLAVCLTKCDVLLKAAENEEEDKVLFGPASSLYIPRSRGGFDKENSDQIDVELREYVRRTIGGGFIQMLDSFEDCRLFAVSALGCNPTGTALPRAVSPFRVEDPFIWLLHKEGLK